MKANYEFESRNYRLEKDLLIYNESFNEGDSIKSPLLDCNNNLLLGNELEFQFYEKEVYLPLNKRININKDDCSLNREDDGVFGAELVIAPITPTVLDTNFIDFKQLFQVINYNELVEPEDDFIFNAGHHIHVNREYINEESLFNLINFVERNIEDLLDISNRTEENFECWSDSLSNHEGISINTFNSLLECNTNKYNWIRGTKNTYEFRFFAGITTYNEFISNNNFIINLLNYFNNNESDENLSLYDLV
jgi:hypothetical protein